MQDSSRQRQRRDWLLRRLGGLPPGGLESASADASFRRYYRLYPRRDGLFGASSSADLVWRTRAQAPETVILMDAPPPREDLGRFVRVARVFRKLGLHVPEILVADETVGFALVSDLGEVTFLRALEIQPQRAPPLYDAAMDALVQLQCAGAGLAPHEHCLAPYDDALLRGELEVFRQWYLRAHLQLPDDAYADVLAPAFDRLVDAALAQPRALVHRDFHTRNLMAAAPLPGILDFQDAVLGPIAYDLASLLRDCYADVPAPLQARCLARFLAGAARAGGRTAADLPSQAQLGEMVDWVAVQRHLKVLGIFVRLWYRDGRADYLQYLPRVRDYLAAACARLAPLRHLGALLHELRGADERAVRVIEDQLASAGNGAGGDGDGNRGGAGGTVAPP